MASSGLRLLFLAILLTHGGSASAQGTPRRVTGQVIDLAGRPVAGVRVFAADAGTDALVAMASSDSNGQVALSLPRRPHHFGILSSSQGVVRLTSRGSGRFELVVRPLPPAPSADQGGAWFKSPRAWILRGRVVDVAGGGLPGVRLEVVRQTGSVTTAVLSGAAGEFAVFLPGGESTVRASAPGLEAVRTARQNDRLVIVMDVTTEVQNITVGEKPMTIRPQDSIDPEYSPPAPVRAYLAFHYGICPAKTPLRRHEKAALKKYWYLDVLRSEPPNPATVSSASCTSPSDYRLPPGQATVGGFEVWQDAVVGNGLE